MAIRSKGGDLALLPQHFHDFLQLVPEEKRLTMAGHISAQLDSVRGYDDILDLAKLMLIELLKGNISPAVAAEARKFIEIMMAAVAGKSGATGAVGSGFLMLHQQLQQVAVGVMGPQAPQMHITTPSTRQVVDLTDIVNLPDVGLSKGDAHLMAASGAAGSIKL